MSRSILVGALFTVVNFALGCATAPRAAPAPAQVPAATTQECAWVTSYGGDDICGVAVPSGATLGCIRTGAKPHGIALSRDGARVYVSNEGANRR